MSPVTSGRTSFHQSARWMANDKSLAAARQTRRDRRDAVAAQTRAQAVSKLQESLASSPLPSSVTGRLTSVYEFDEEAPLQFPTSDTPMELPSEDDYSDPAAPDTRSTASKRKSDALSDSESSDSTTPVKPPRKKPGPKPKAKPTARVSDSQERAPKAAPKKAAAKKAVPRKKKKKAEESDSESVEVVETSIVFMIPEGSSEGNRRASVAASTSFEDAVEIIHETIGCVSVSRKPSLAYRFSTSNAKEAEIQLSNDKDWAGLITDATAKIRAKKDLRVTIFVLPENYMFSIRAKNKKKPAATKSKKKGPMTALDLDNDESEPDEEDDRGIVDEERKAMADLDSEYRKCARCGPTLLCKVDRGGKHVHLTFPQRRAWAAFGTHNVTKSTPPKSELFSMFHKKVNGNASPVPPPIAAPFPPHPAFPWYPPMPPAGYGMPGFPGYPQTPVAPVAPPAHALLPMLSSDAADDFGPSYPSITDFIEMLIVKTPQRHSLRDVAETLDSLHFFDINEIVHLTANDLGDTKFGSVILGDAQFLVKEVAKEVKRLDKVAKRARYQ
ncbi:hypothetical protein C8F04DRAFT_1203446 [Mycena alexandri]|uniref:Uncharacterized protein n=1 Tax=Mycena alexandri TaxID=1745969 RepID=A0AAD6RWF5_9AGAR|nr:hypothetical protein C8F04DRAFT_1203446 [Mycena alexandri]